MKKLAILFLILFVALGVSAQENLSQQAEGFYQEGKYRDAVDAYNKILSGGMESKALFYNIGNCYYKLGENTRAILNYERALLLNPGDKDVKYNLEMAQKQVIDKIEILPELFLIRWYKDFVSCFSSNQWAYISIGLFVVFLTMLALFLYSTSMWIKKSGFTVGIIMLFLTVMSIVFTVKESNRVEKREYAIVLTPSVTVRGAPDNSGTELFVIHEGLKVRILGSLGNWMNIRLGDGNEGWVSKSDIEKI